MSPPALVATCWTSAGSVAPLDTPEISPFSAIDRIHAAASTGWAGIGFGQDVRLEVFGSLDSFGAGIDACTPMTSTEPGISPPGARYDQFIDRFERAFRAEADAFARLVAGTGVNLTPPRDGLVAIRIAQAAAESIRTSSTIDLN